MTNENDSAVWQGGEPPRTVAAVQRRVAHIANASDDPESAHGMEDDLHQDVLQSIANGAVDARALASAALRTRAVKFPRLCS